MTSLQTLISTAMTLATQTAVDPNAGTAMASAGAVKRLQEPTYYDAIFPFIAFLLVIVIPAGVAMWVIYKTVTDKTMEADET